jgi:dUTP pyrophosphatase
MTCQCGKARKVRIFRINKNNPLPSQANTGDAGYDVYASEDILFSSGDVKLVPLGIIAEAPKGFHFKLCLRSSMAYKRGFRQPNAPGIIDHLYAGKDDEIKLMLEAPNLKLDETVLIKEGERVGQLILEKNNPIEWDEQNDRDFVGKSRGGFGSSGIK